jgi:hypothetical protein
LRLHMRPSWRSQMRPGGTTIFTDPDDYRTSIPGVEVGMAFARGGQLSAFVICGRSWPLRLAKPAASSRRGLKSSLAGRRSGHSSTI